MHPHLVLPGVRTYGAGALLCAAVGRGDGPASLKGVRTTASSTSNPVVETRRVRRPALAGRWGATLGTTQPDDPSSETLALVRGAGSLCTTASLSPATTVPTSSCSSSCTNTMPDTALGATALLRLSATSEEKRKEMMAWPYRGRVEQVVVTQTRGTSKLHEAAMFCKHHTPFHSWMCGFTAYNKNPDNTPPWWARDCTMFTDRPSSGAGACAHTYDEHVDREEGPQEND